MQTMKLVLGVTLGVFLNLGKLVDMKVSIYHHQIQGAMKTQVKDQIRKMHKDIDLAGGSLIPKCHLRIFFLDLSFKDLKLFKKELVEFSTKRGFEFTYIKNDAVRVKAACSAKNCTWLILCSWCSAKKSFTVKHYVSQHTCLLGATRNRRVTAPVVAKRYGELIYGMPFVTPRHLRSLVRKDMGVFITNKVCRNAKGWLLREWKSNFGRNLGY